MCFWKEMLYRFDRVTVIGANDSVNLKTAVAIELSPLTHVDFL